MALLNFRPDRTATFTLERFFSEGVTNEPQPVFTQFDAEWKVNADCTGMVDLMEFGGQVDWVFVAVSSGNELHLVSGATLTSVDAKRLSKKRGIVPKWSRGHSKTGSRICTPKSVAGKYGGNIDSIAGQIEGQNNALVAVYDLQKNGSLLVTMEGFIENLDGTVSPLKMDDIRGTWEINRDCTGRMEYEIF